MIIINYNKRTHEEYVKLINDRFPLKYTILSEYKNAQSRIWVKCNKCGCEWNPVANNLLRGKGCPQCFGNKKYTTETFKEKVYQMYGEEYKVLGEYVNSQTKIKIKHNKCGFEYDVKPNNFINGRQCPNCKNERLSLSNIKDHDQFCKEVQEIANGQYEVISQYKGKKKKVKLLHKLCNSIYTVTPDNFLHKGTRCPLCKVSKGEEEIKNFLIKHNLPFEIEYSFDDLKYNDFLRFDFAVFCDEDKKKIYTLIEYDGEFHYHPILGDKHLEIQRKRDELKNEYCLIKNLKLIRIPYWNFGKIEEILSKELLSKIKNKEEFVHGNY